MTGGNARHQAALAATAEDIATLRHDIRAQLDVLVDLDEKLTDLLDTRQAVAIGFLTDELRAARDEQVRADRAAARGIQERHATPGLEWLNRDHRLGSGQVAAAVTVPAASASAQLHFGILDHGRRLARKARLVALELEQTEEEDHGVCAWPRRPIGALEFDTDDTSLRVVADRFAVLVDAYTNRPGLKKILEDLEHLEEVALDVVDGRATPVPGECPWCGRPSLVLQRPQPYKPHVIRCAGAHRCQCADEWCRCQRNPHKHRHEWTNSGRATHSWTQLTREQNRRKELMALETRALDLLAQIAGLHTPHWTDAEGNRRTHYVLVDGEYVRDHLPEHQCIDIGLDRCEVYDDDPSGSLHSVLGCVECQVTVNDGEHGYRIWPCPTARLTDLDNPPTTTDTTEETKP